MDNKLDSTFIFPYSNNGEEKRKQVWSNLQKGILLEDKQVFIPWEMPFNQLDKFKETFKENGGRNIWYLGGRKILNGYVCHIEVEMMSYLPWLNPMTEIYENLGYDSTGMKNFNFLKEHISDLLGHPDKIEIEKWGAYDLGVIRWINDKVHLTLTGVEIFNARYSLRIGLLRDKNHEYLDNSIKELKKRGITEEELGK